MVGAELRSAVPAIGAFARLLSSSPVAANAGLGAQPKPIKEAAAEAGVQLSMGDPLTSRPVADAEVKDLVSRICKLNLVQVVMLSEELKEALGIDPDMMMGLGGAVVAAPVAGGGAAANDGPKEEEAAAPAKTHFDVVLKGFDAKDKIKVIKEVRAVTGLGLKEAKDLVEGAPQPVKTNLKKEEAEALMKQLTEIGAQIEIA
jgi:large subunit ribosomal protein L7/L12